jgi:3-isopropylmalate dehydrogenase
MSRRDGGYRIGVIPGDGVGPEVVRQGLKVLERVAGIAEFQYDLVEYPWSSEHYLATGELMPEPILDEYRSLDAIYLGALGDPRVERGLLERAVLLTIRLSLDLYINLRPIVLYAEHLTPIKGVQPEDVEVAIAEMVYTRHGVERAVRHAFELARERDAGRKVTLVDKSNAIRPQELWRRVFAEVAAGYPDLQTDAMYVDAAAMHMVSNPAQFDVIVTTNLFGDIITDLGAVIQGGMGSAASGNIHPGRVSMFEPIHGSAPDIAGRNVASPVGAIAALSMLLDHLGERWAASLIEHSIRDLLVSRRIPSLDARSGLSTDQVGDLLVAEVERQAEESATV